MTQNEEGQRKSERELSRPREGTGGGRGVGGGGWGKALVSSHTNRIFEDLSDRAERDTEKQGES